MRIETSRRMRIGTSSFDEQKGELQGQTRRTETDRMAILRCESRNVAPKITAPSCNWFPKCKPYQGHRGGPGPRVTVRLERMAKTVTGQGADNRTSSFARARGPLVSTTRNKFAGWCKRQNTAPRRLRPRWVPPAPGPEGNVAKWPCPGTNRACPTNRGSWVSKWFSSPMDRSSFSPTMGGQSDLGTAQTTWDGLCHKGRGIVCQRTVPCCVADSCRKKGRKKCPCGLARLSQMMLGRTPGLNSAIPPPARR